MSQPGCTQFTRSVLTPPTTSPRSVTIGCWETGWEQQVALHDSHPGEKEKTGSSRTFWRLFAPVDLEKLTTLRFRWTTQQILFSAPQQRLPLFVFPLLHSMNRWQQRLHNQSAGKVLASGFVPHSSQQTGFLHRVQCCSVSRALGEKGWLFSFYFLYCHHGLYDDTAECCIIYAQPKHLMCDPHGVSESQLYNHCKLMSNFIMLS